MAYQYALADDEFARAELSSVVTEQVTEAAVDAIQEDGRLKASLFAAFSVYDPGVRLCDIAAHLEVPPGGKMVRLVFDDAIPDAAVDLFNAIAMAALVDQAHTAADDFGNKYTVLPGLGVWYGPGSSWVGDYELSVTSAMKYNESDWWSPPPPLYSFGFGLPPGTVSAAFSSNYNCSIIPVEVLPLPYGIRLAGVDIAAADLIVRKGATLE